MDETLRRKIKEFENETNSVVLYLSEYGSKLYGTNDENSDTDYKGIFIQHPDKVLLGKYLEHWTSNTNNTKEKNTSVDIDLQLFSVNKFFKLLRKGETGALDILFSIWSKETIVFQDTVFVDHMKMYYKDFLNKNLHSFSGYAVGQAKKYGIKGSRYKELDEFRIFFLDELLSKYEEGTLSDVFPEVKHYFEEKTPKYLRFSNREGPKTGKGKNIIEYLELLGKFFSGDIKVSHFSELLEKMFEQFGNRTKASTEGVDYKALSHSVRVLLEVEELLDDGFITFPLKESDFVKDVKEGKVPVDAVMIFVNTKLEQVKEKLDNSTLPEKSNSETMDWLELFFFDLYFRRTCMECGKQR